MPFSAAETDIHPLAIVEPGAELGAGVSIGPFCHVGPDAVIGDRCRLISHVAIMGATTLGEDCVVWPNAVLGGQPQNFKHKGGRTTLVIGRNNTIREAVTMHVGTDTSRGTTTVGDDGLFMAGIHIAHDCEIGNGVNFANGVMLGGHCEVADHVIIGGMTAVHQFARIGHHAFLAGCSAVRGDVIPYGFASGNNATLHGFNIVGMKRSGMPRPQIYALRKAYRMIFDAARPMAENLGMVAKEFAADARVMDIVGFLTERGSRQFVLPDLKSRTAAGGDDDD